MACRPASPSIQRMVIHEVDASGAWRAKAPSATAAELAAEDRGGHRSGGNRRVQAENVPEGAAVHEGAPPAEGPGPGAENAPGADDGPGAHFGPEGSGGAQGVAAAAQTADEHIPWRGRGRSAPREHELVALERLPAEVEARRLAPKLEAVFVGPLLDIVDDKGIRPRRVIAGGGGADDLRRHAGGDLVELFGVLVFLRATSAPGHYGACTQGDGGDDDRDPKPRGVELGGIVGAFVAALS
mmetsp:Transcript_3585/g.13118  ORF Transcript_3585/g.13118 Transcript_3585/m.13118 type:complete len:241 (+) Transcript_3585:207-929(+)